MNQLAAALEENYDNSSSIGRMVQRSKGSKRRLLPNVKRRKLKNKSTLTHEQEVMYTYKNGYGIMRPCNMLHLKPGSNVMAHGRPGVAKWCLATPKSKMYLVVVLFNNPQVIRGKHGVRSRWAMIESDFIEKIKW